MQVLELANDLKVSTDTVLHLLREMGIAVPGADATVSDADVARVLARVERERRAGHKDLSEAVKSALEEAQAAHQPRRRRRRSAVVVEEAPAVEEAAAETESEAEDAVGADAPVAAAESEDAAPAPVEAEAVEAVEAEEAEVEATEPEAEAADEVEAAPVEEPETVVEEPEAGAEETTEPTADVEVEAEPAAPEADAAPAAPAPAAPPGEKPQPVRAGAPSGPVRRLRKPGPGGPGFGGTPAAGTVRVSAEGYTADGKREDPRNKKGKKGRRGVDQGAVQNNIQRVMADLRSGGGKKRRRGKVKPTREELETAQEEARQERELEAKTIRVNEFLTVAELAELMDVSASEIVGAAFKNLGLLVTINQRLDFDQIELLLDEFNFTAIREDEYSGEEEEIEDDVDPPESMVPRPPVVTVMGHVDHGKTRLLDAVRDTNVVAGESGGITQHIGAYHVELPGDRAVTFLDTPGHAAFTAMRARGADVTDIVILMVAADDSVMPQTIEAISHAKNAGVPMLVAINKVDLPTANPARVKQELLQHDVTVEEFGGEVLSAEISAKEGIGIDDLLEKVLLMAEMMELKANPDREAKGIVIETQLDVGKGPVMSVLVQKGTLRVGDSFLVGLYDGRVRALLDERGNAVDEAGPGIPVQVLGSPGVPQAGDTFQVMDPVKAAEVAQTRQRLDREKQLRIRERGIKLGDFSQLLAEGKTTRLPLIIKGDVDGSVQAVADSLEQLGTGEVAVEVIHRAVGAINESDVLLAGTAGAIIIGFRVRPDANARALAEKDDIDIHSYDVIYEAVDEVKAALEGLLAPERKETIVGAAEVREVFKVSKVGTIAGSMVTEGVITRKSQVRLIRDGIVIYTGGLASLKRFKDDAKEVRDGLECGIGIEKFNDIKVGDVIEAYEVEEVARTLADSAKA